MPARSLASRLVRAALGRLPAVALVGAALIVGAWIVGVQPANACTGPACVGSGGGTSVSSGVEQLTQTFDFSTSGQSLWGQGTSTGASLTTTMIDPNRVNLDSSVDMNKESKFDLYDELGSLLDGVGLSGLAKSVVMDGIKAAHGDVSYTYGAKAHANINGSVGANLTLAAGPGSVSVDASSNVTVNYPPAYSFAPGDTVELRVFVSDGTTHLVATPPNASATTAVHGDFSSSAWAEGCVDHCLRQDLYSPVNKSGDASYTVGGAGIRVPLNNSSPGQAALAFAAGMTGYLGVPGITHDATATGAVSSTGSDDFTNVQVDLDAWLSRVAKVPDVLGGGTVSLHGASIGYSILNGGVNVDLQQQQTLTFTPTTLVTLTFSRPLDYVVKSPGGSVVGNGTAASVTVPSSALVDVTIPAGDDSPITVATSAQLQNSFHNHTQLQRTSSLDLTGLSFTASTPKATIFNSRCADFVVGKICTKKLTWPSFSTSAGPALDVRDLAPVTFTDNLFDQGWSLGGFAQAAGQSFTLAPDYAPVADPGGPYTVDEGSVVTLDASASSDQDGPGDPLTYAWDFNGDGTPDATGPQADYTGRDGDGIETVRLTVCDSHSVCDAVDVPITVNNVAPALALQPFTTDEGSTATLNGTITDPGALDTFTVAIDWGDGQTEQDALPAGTTTFSIPHVYVDDNPTGTPSDQVPVSATVTDDDGGSSGPVSTTATVNNVPPSVQITWLSPPLAMRMVPGGATGSGAMADTPASGISATINEGDLILLDIQITDPGAADTFTAKVDWGDGHVDTVALGTERAREFDHVYADDPPGVGTSDYIPTVTVTDDDTGQGTAAATVHVTNLPPVVTVDQPAAVDEGGTATLTGTITDVPADSFVATIDWGDGQTDALDLPAGTTTYSATHVYVDDNPTGTPSDVTPIAVSVADDDGGVGTAATSITVSNVAPTVTATGGQGIVFDDLALPALATITDPGIADTFTASIDWGDGTTSDGTVSGSGGTWTVSADHAYQSVGTFTVTVTATDDDTGQGTATATVEIIGGKALFQAALDALQPYAHESKSIGQAITSLQKILDDRYWADEVTLTPQGKKVFTESSKAASDLQRLIGGPPQGKGKDHAERHDDRAHPDGHAFRGAVSDAALAAAQQSLQRIVTADRLLASRAIDAASAAPLNSREATRALQRAQDAFAQAETLAAAGRYPEAIKQYGEAWSSAQQLLGQAEREFQRHGESIAWQSWWARWHGPSQAGGDAGHGHGHGGDGHGHGHGG